MEPKYFFYSEQQRDMAIGFDSRRNVNHVFINGEFVPYTEMSRIDNSNWSDAISLGVHPQWWIKCGGVIQCEKLADFIESGNNPYRVSTTNRK